MISGALVFSDPMRDFPRGIVHNESIVVYNSLTDLQHKILYYLNHPEERQAIASRGRYVSLTKHQKWQTWERLYLEDWSIMDDNGISILD